MPQYPFETSVVNDRHSYRSKSGRKYTYQNYNVKAYTFTWTFLDETKRGQLKDMYDNAPLIAFYSNSTCFGTFRFSDDTWQDKETAFELYDLSFTIEEEASLPVP